MGGIIIFTNYNKMDIDNLLNIVSNLNNFKNLDLHLIISNSITYQDQLIDLNILIEEEKLNNNKNILTLSLTGNTSLNPNNNNIQWNIGIKANSTIFDNSILSLEEKFSILKITNKIISLDLEYKKLYISLNEIINDYIIKYNSLIDSINKLKYEKEKLEYVKLQKEKLNGNIESVIIQESNCFTAYFFIFQNFLNLRMVYFQFLKDSGQLLTLTGY